ncbi:MAG TPA: DUF2892 domain-containing protein [Rubrobacteraceae bacterium]|nr:DUF2892 domain-containing protein [Rubrobacteraceae bacterium]
MAFARFMSEPTGRILRVVAGLALIVLGFLIGGTAGVLIVIVGLVPVAAGAFNYCLIGPLIGGYFDGRKNLEGRPPRTHRGAHQH